MKVLSNLAISLDGKIATSDRAFFPLGTPYDRKRMNVIRKKADAILMGAGSLRTYKSPLIVSGVEKQKLNVIVSRNLDRVSPQWKFFTSKRVKRLLIVERLPSKTRLKEFEKTSTVVKLPMMNAAKIVKCLRDHGVKSLLVEGGGEVMWMFAKQNAIHDYFVTLTPRILGGSTAPTLVDGDGFSPAKSLKLKLRSARKVGQEIYLQYSK